MDLFQSPSLVEQSQFVASLKANNSGGAGPSEIHSGEELLSDAVVVGGADEEDWDLDRILTAAEAYESGLEKRFVSCRSSVEHCTPRSLLVWAMWCEWSTVASNYKSS